MRRFFGINKKTMPPLSIVDQLITKPAAADGTTFEIHKAKQIIRYENFKDNADFSSAVVADYFGM